jgi:hypothetical protein
LATVMKPISDLRLLITGLPQERRTDPDDLGAPNNRGGERIHQAILTEAERYRAGDKLAIAIPALLVTATKP